jgi:hypothetical protein
MSRFEFGATALRSARRLDKLDAAARKAKQSSTELYSNTQEHEYESAVRRKAELLAANPTTIFRHGDASPEREYYAIRMHREDCGGGFVASFTDWDLELRYRTTYGKYDADSLWSYSVPAGAKEVF